MPTFAIIRTMSNVTLHAQRLTLNAKRLFIVHSLLFIVLILSGCSAVGYSDPAALQVTSKPEASVFLNGKHVGKTPFYSDQLKVGEYTLKITVSDADYVDKINLTEGTLTVINRELSKNFLAQSGENLSLINGKKGLFINSFPNETNITIDGRYIGETPYLIEDLKEGDHNILLSKTGYVDREFAIHASLKYQLLADVTLASKIAKGIGVNQQEPKAPEVQHVLVLNAPQGFLRVRLEPSLSASELGKVNTGDEFDIIQEIEDWFQISYEGKLGWISAAYVEKVK